ncbi:MAG: alpha/beta fold hydrolase [Gordonia sp. (in: high G+C Gram-positive bacteria)]|uniref:lipase family protein n=1 Tax=Gordonia sp. (in: high G+C Gram-positive bacteria) TaxID=84139 RepID=UPI0039E248F6
MKLRWVAVLVVTALCGLFALHGAPASAAPATTAVSTDAFYRPPSPLPSATPGTVLKKQRFDLALSLPSAQGPIPATATRLMYLSTDTNGRPTAVTGTYLTTTAAWNGPGPRPTVAVAPGTQGQGDQCAPSKLLGEVVHYSWPLDLFSEYEVATLYPLLAQGMNVVMTDYHGLGTPAIHDYLNRKAEAYAVLDSLRAAADLTGHTGPLGVFGYSQGGGAAAAAAEMQASYAPELDIRGTYAGGPPADLARSVLSPAVAGILPGEIGGFALGLIGYVINGLFADYPELRPQLDRELNAAGKAWVKRLSGTCLFEMVTTGMLRSERSMTTSGKSLTEIMGSNKAIKAAIDEQRIGTLKPQAPVLIVSGRNDDVIPYGQARTLARNWCAKGATVRLDDTGWIPPILPYTAEGHLLPFIPALTEASLWFHDRLAGKPAPNNCRSLP